MSRVVLENLSKSFGEVNVVNDISLEIIDHEFLSFLGPSGCGNGLSELRSLAEHGCLQERSLPFEDE
jgi:ABC-type sugar transport system ATPase subunit